MFRGLIYGDVLTGFYGIISFEIFFMIYKVF